MRRLSFYHGPFQGRTRRRPFADREPGFEHTDDVVDHCANVSSTRDSSAGESRRSLDFGVAVIDSAIRESEAGASAISWLLYA